MSFDVEGEPWRRLHSKYLYYKEGNVPQWVSGSEPRIMIAIGHYDRPAAVELNILAIRHYCGHDIPILISDDGSTPELLKELRHITCQHENVWLWPNMRRIGHSGGDLGAFWKGLNWAGTGCWDGHMYHPDNGYDVLFKLSQRFIVTQKNWAQHWAKKLMESKHATLGRSCSTHGFDVRTEAIGLKVASWFRPEILSHIHPRRVGIAAEAVIYEVIRDKFGGTMLLWDLLAPGRGIKVDGYLFRETHTPEEYDALSAQLGHNPGGITVEDSNKMEGYVHG